MGVTSPDCKSISIVVICISSPRVVKLPVSTRFALIFFPTNDATSINPAFSGSYCFKVFNIVNLSMTFSVFDELILNVRLSEKESVSQSYSVSFLILSNGKTAMEFELTVVCVFVKRFTTWNSTRIEIIVPAIHERNGLALNLSPSFLQPFNTPTSISVKMGASLTINEKISCIPSIPFSSRIPMDIALISD